MTVMLVRRGRAVRPGRSRRERVRVRAAAHSCVAHRDCHPDPVMSPGSTWATATGWSTVEDWVAAQLSARWGAAGAADFDQGGVCAEVREGVNDNLPTGWTLDENQFVGPTPIPEDALYI